ncbi:energy transducer TonB [Sphingomonas psychrotolerans]|uniref:Energy transducer TonB n=1 Tax=Sphingomonas psychrotolerans TaxID=1327635 RepID=A0ABU3N2Z7_9SPHN|nr:energy transducer TonB [Sphingomonas psychrotolerans]MDT8757595.1 energy transducer TonB [Sphingomonas psychrotolerans]
MLLLISGFLQSAEVPKGSLAAPPKPKTPPGNWVTNNDYPANAIRENLYGTLHFTLTIDVTGKPDGCHITWTSGFAELDQYSCAIFLKRASFYPARDDTGKPVRGTFSSTFRWELPEGAKARDVPGIDLVVEVAQLPAGYARPALTRVHFGRSGKPDSCRVEASSGNAAIDKVACAQVMSQAPAPTDRIAWGAIPDTRMVQVSFEAAKAK